ncbi:MAG: hypothetical protein WC635_17495 [Bacteriovorax sp.]|jgi:hypothetical protein
MTSSNEIITATVGVSLPVAFYFYNLYYRKFIFREQELLANGLGFEKEIYLKGEDGFLKRKIVKRKVKGFYDRKKQKFVLTIFNPSITNHNIKDKSPVIEKITGKKVIEARIEKKWFKYRAVFYLENFKEIISEKDLNQNLPLGSYWLGQNAKQENIVIDTKKLPFLFIGGGQGSGKSVCIVSQVLTLFKSYSDNGKPLPRLILVSSAKATEFIPLIQKLKKTTEVLVFNANSLDEIKQLNDLLEAHIKKCEEFFEILSREELLVRHWGDVEHEKKVLPTHWIFDEAPQYLREDTKIKLTKDSSDLEREAYQLQEEKKRLALLINKSLETLRETGTTFVIASQYGTQDLMIGFTNLKACFLLGRGLTKQVFSIWGVPPELTEGGLGRGLFAYFDGKDYGILKTPLLTTEEKKK